VCIVFLRTTAKGQGRRVILKKVVAEIVISGHVDAPNFRSHKRKAEEVKVCYLRSRAKLESHLLPFYLLGKYSKPNPTEIQRTQIFQRKEKQKETERNSNEQPKQTTNRNISKIS